MLLPILFFVLFSKLPTFNQSVFDIPASHEKMSHSTGYGLLFDFVNPTKSQWNCSMISCFPSEFQWKCHMLCIKAPFFGTKLCLCWAWRTPSRCPTSPVALWASVPTWTVSDSETSRWCLGLAMVNLVGKSGISGDDINKIKDVFKCWNHEADPPRIAYVGIVTNNFGLRNDNSDV